MSKTSMIHYIVLVSTALNFILQFDLTSFFRILNRPIVIQQLRNFILKNEVKNEQVNKIKRFINVLCFPDVQKDEILTQDH